MFDLRIARCFGKVAAWCGIALMLHGCWNDAKNNAAPAKYTVGGTVVGLTTAGLVLSNGRDSVSVPSNATSFVFPASVAVGESYSVAISTQPADAQCSIANGAGTMGAAPVTAVTVTCAAVTETIGGSITGLQSAGLMLANGSDSLSPAAGATSFQFALAVAEGATYSVSITTQPQGAQCTLTNASGTVGTSAVTSVQVACQATTETIGGSITGLAAAGLVLANGSNTLSVSSGATSFIFAQPVAAGSTYAVSVQTQPAGENCMVGNGSGTVAGTAPVGNITVTCSPTLYHVGGTITGLTAAGLVLANGSDTVSPPSGATNFTLPTPIPSGSAYSVTVKTQPAGISCAVAGTFPATIGAADVTNISVTCGAATQLPLLVGRETCPASGPKIINGTGANGSPGNIQTAFALDAAGNLYQTSPYGVVLKVTPAGVLTILAGTEFISGNLPPETDGTGAAARFEQLSDIAVTADGASLYVADFDEVRKVTAAGVVTTLVHNVTPYGVAVNAAGTVYFTDDSNSSVRAIAPDGTVTFLADGTSTAVPFNYPGGIALDSSGNLYIADTLNSLIRKVTPAGVVTTLAGGAAQYGDGTGAAAGFGQPRDLSIDASGNLFVVDEVRTAIRKVTPAGVVTTVATTPLFTSQYGHAQPAGALLLPVNTTSVNFVVTPNDTIIVPVGCAIEETQLP